MHFLSHSHVHTHTHTFTHTNTHTHTHTHTHTFTHTNTHTNTLTHSHQRHHRAQYMPLYTACFCHRNTPIHTYRGDTLILCRRLLTYSLQSDVIFKLQSFPLVPLSLDSRRPSALTAEMLAFPFMLGSPWMTLIPIQHPAIECPMLLFCPTRTLEPQVLLFDWN